MNWFQIQDQSSEIILVIFLFYIFSLFLFQIFLLEKLKKSSMNEIGHIFLKWLSILYIQYSNNLFHDSLFIGSYSSTFIIWYWFYDRLIEMIFFIIFITISLKHAVSAWKQYHFFNGDTNSLCGAMLFSKKPFDLSF